MKEFQLTNRTAPQNIEAEQSILGGIILDNQSLNIVLEILQEGDFYSNVHRKIFKAIVELSEINAPFDLIVLSNILTDRGQIEQIGGAAYLAAMVSNVPSAANISYYAKIVKEKSILRSLINSLSLIINESYSETGGVDDLLALAQKEILEISKIKSAGKYVSMKDCLLKAIEKIHKSVELGGALDGSSTGFHRVDNMLNGLKGGLLYIIAGRPGSGKSVMLFNIAENVARHGKIVLFNSFEMPMQELATRIISSNTEIDSRRISRGMLTDSEILNIVNKSNNLSKLSMFIDHDGGLPIDKLLARIRQKKLDGGCDMVVVDYLQLVRPSQKWGTREQEVSEVSRKLKEIAKELDIPVISGAQINRNSQNRPDREPTLSDLRESGAIEQDADVVGFLHPKIDFEIMEVPTKFIVAKNRQGATGITDLVLHKKFTLFKESKNTGQ